MTVPPAPAASTAAAPLGAGRVLIVDDEEVIRRALRRFFERMGWAVDQEEEGAAALARILAPGAPAYDVVLVDLRMPGMPGEALYDALAAARPELARRVVVSTGDPFGGGAAEFLARTGCAVLNKPFELAELRAVVERVTGAP